MPLRDLNICPPFALMAVTVLLGLALIGARTTSAEPLPDCSGDPELVLLDLSAHDLLASDNPEDLYFAALMARSELILMRSPSNYGKCLFRSGAVPWSTSRYLLKLIREHPGYPLAFPSALEHCRLEPLTSRQCLHSKRVSCEVDEDAEATQSLCSMELARQWIDHDEENALAWREFALNQFENGDIDGAFAALKRAVRAGRVSSTRSHVYPAVWSAYQRLYPSAIRESLEQWEEAANFLDYVGFMDSRGRSIFARLCEAQSESSDDWLDLCLTFWEKVELEADGMNDAIYAASEAQSLLELKGNPKAAERVGIRIDELFELENCYLKITRSDRSPEFELYVSKVAELGVRGAQQWVCDKGRSNH